MSSPLHRVQAPSDTVAVVLGTATADFASLTERVYLLAREDVRQAKRIGGAAFQQYLLPFTMVAFHARIKLESASRSAALGGADNTQLFVEVASGVSKGRISVNSFEARAA